MTSLDDKLILVLIGLVCLGLGYFTYFLNKYIEKISAESSKIKDSAKREIFVNALADLEDIVDKNVKATEQLVAKDLREMIKNNQISKSQLEDVGKSIFEEIKGSLTQDTKDALSKNMVDVDNYIQSSIEAKVLEIKS